MLKPTETGLKGEQNHHVNGLQAPFQSGRVQSGGVLQGSTCHAYPVSKKPQYCFSYGEIWLGNFAKQNRKECVRKDNVRQHTNTHSEADTSSLCYFQVQPTSDSAEVRKRPDHNAKSRLKMSKATTAKAAIDGGVARGRPESLWQAQSILGNDKSPSWASGSRDPERATEEMAGRRQDWNSLTLFGGLEVFA